LLNASGQLLILERYFIEIEWYYGPPSNEHRAPLLSRACPKRERD